MTPKPKFDSRTLTALVMLAALSLLPATIARAQEDQPGTPHPDDPGSPATPSEKAEATTGDAEILAQLMAIDETEVRAATVAQQKKVTGPVLRFAKMLEADHGRDIEDVQSLTQTLGLTLSDTTTVDQLHARGEEMMTRLAPLTGDDFGRAYVTQMVSGHREALQMIDDFLKTAQNEEVRQHLQQVRAKIATHLKEAERLSVGRTERPASSESRDQPPLTS